MNFIHIIDVIFFIVLPIGVIAYAIKYAWEDVNEYNYYCDEDNPFYCQNCGFSYEDTEDTCPYH